jgi:hypothetical protein
MGHAFFHNPGNLVNFSKLTFYANELVSLRGIALAFSIFHGVKFISDMASMLRSNQVPYNARVQPIINLALSCTSMLVAVNPEGAVNIIAAVSGRDMIIPKFIIAHMLIPAISVFANNISNFPEAENNANRTNGNESALGVEV